ncbi:MAG: YciI family protein [Acidimicrobiia bacterium]|nr:YciI family protein [Acidimicrobiia bacterium]
MKYACLIYGDESGAEDMDPTSAEFQAVMAAYMAFGDKYASQIVAGEPLEASSTATTVQVRDGKVLTTDGPFAETKEQLGGFYIVEAADLDEALKIAADIPGAAHGTVEVRPVPNFG